MPPRGGAGRSPTGAEVTGPIIGGWSPRASKTGKCSRPTESARCPYSRPPPLPSRVRWGSGPRPRGEQRQDRARLQDGSQCGLTAAVAVADQDQDQVRDRLQARDQLQDGEGTQDQVRSRDQLRGRLGERLRWGG